VVVVHDNLSLEDIVERFAAITYDTHEAADDNYEACQADLRRKVADLKARDAFLLLNDDLPEAKRFKRLGEVATPVAADFYDAGEDDYE
jgi:hypothetical protein